MDQEIYCTADGPFEFWNETLEAHIFWPDCSFSKFWVAIGTDVCGGVVLMSQAFLLALSAGVRSIVSV